MVLIYEFTCFYYYKNAPRVSTIFLKSTIVLKSFCFFLGLPPLLLTNTYIPPLLTTNLRFIIKILRLSHNLYGLCPFLFLYKLQVREHMLYLSSFWLILLSMIFSSPIQVAVNCIFSYIYMYIHHNFIWIHLALDIWAVFIFWPFVSTAMNTGGH